MMLKDAGNQEGRRMGVKIRREIGNTDLVMAVDLAAPDRRWRRRAAVRDPTASREKLVLRTVQNECARVRRHCGLACAYFRGDQRAVRRKAAPIAAIGTGQDQISGRIGKLWGGSDEPPVSGCRLIIAPHLEERGCPVA